MKLKSMILGIITLMAMTFISSVYADDCPPTCAPTATNSNTSDNISR